MNIAEILLKMSGRGRGRNRGRGPPYDYTKRVKLIAKREDQHRDDRSIVITKNKACWILKQMTHRRSIGVEH